MNLTRPCEAVGSTSVARARGPRFSTRSGHIFSFSFCRFKRGSCQLLAKVLVNRLGVLSLPRKSVVRLIDHPNMIIDV